MKTHFVDFLFCLEKVLERIYYQLHISNGWSAIELLWIDECIIQSHVYRPFYVIFCDELVCFMSAGCYID